MKQSTRIQVINAISRAGKAILDIYESGDFGLEVKSDDSPLTRADRAAHHILEKVLSNTGEPILSEEGESVPYSERKTWTRYWLVDPLDGTKEFIKKNDEFTVNVAYIVNNQAYSGFVYAPVLGDFYMGINQELSLKFKIKAGDEIKEIPANALVLKAKKPENPLKIVASRSHFNQETELYINKLKEEYSDIEFFSKGSSLKLCMVAEGKAHIYPRFGPTMEWDTAAAHAVVLGAKAYIETPEGKPLKYNKENLLNPFFIVKA